MKHFLIFFLILFVESITKAQQLDQIGKKGGVKFSGGFGVNQSLYFSDGVSNRFSPYNYAITGNVGLSVYGISIPVSFAYSNQNFTYSRQPFNVVGLSPTYKSLTLHGGYRNMSFSPYTLAGHSFLGGGLEWKPKGGFNIAAMGGRLLRAVEYDSTNASSRPAYDRYGGGIKLSYSRKGSEYTLIGFYAKDERSSIKPVPNLVNVKPQENMVYSLGFKKALLKNVNFNFEGALSGWTRDISDSVSTEKKKLYQNVYFMPIKQSTVFYGAIKTGLDIDMKVFKWGLGFERITPEYRTLGAYYFNNDFQNVTANLSTALFKKKLSLSTNFGLQHDDLRNTKATKMKRFVGSLTASFKASERLNLNMSYSNFSSFTTVKPYDRTLLQNTAYDRIDTMNFVQLTQSLNAGATYKLLENDNVSHNLNSSGNYQVANNKQGNRNFGNSAENASLGYNLTFKKSSLSVGASANGNVNNYDQGKAIFAGLGVRSSMPLLKKKLRVSLTANLSNNYEKGSLRAQVFAVNNSYSLKLFKKHSLNANLRYSGRIKKADAELGTYNTSFNEFMGTLGYSFSF